MSTRYARPAVLFCCLCWLATGRGAPPGDKGETPDARKPDISKLSNEELEKQATAIYSRGSGDYLAEVRDPLRLRTFGEVGSDDEFSRWQGQLQKSLGGVAPFQTAVSFARTGRK